MYEVGPGAPLASLAWDTACLDMKLRVWIEKVMLVVHLRSLEEGAVGNLIYQEQRVQDWPDLASETKVICEELDVEDCNITQIGKVQFRKYITKACLLKNEEILRKMAEGKEKCQRLTSESYGRKEYIEQKCIGEVREWYRSRYGQRPFAGNFSKDKRLAKSEWLCRCGAEREKELHIISGNCPVYSDIRGKYSTFEKDEDLVSFFNEVLSRRDQINNLEQEELDSR